MPLQDKNLPIFEDLDINFKSKTVFLDMDGTLAPDKNDHINDRVAEKVREIQENNTVYLCSNSGNKIRKKIISELLGLEIINHSLKKPSRRITNGVPNGDGFLVIGDKLLIDGWFAKRIGGKFIKVKRKVLGDEHFFMKMINVLDDFLCKFVE